MIELLFPGNLADLDGLAIHLANMGLSPEICEPLARRFAKASAALSIVRPAETSPPAWAFFVPGQIDILGKHTSCAGGRKLVAAPERGVCAVALPREDSQVVVMDAVSGETVVFHISSDQQPSPDKWSEGAIRVARRVASNFPGANRGADIAFVNDLPSEAGLGAANALTTSVFLVLAEANRLTARDEYWYNLGNRIDLAAYLGAIATSSDFGSLTAESIARKPWFEGSEDQPATLCAEARCLSQFAFRPLEFEKTLPLPSDYVLAVGYSGLPVETALLVEEDRQWAAGLIDAWRRETGRHDRHLAAALGSSPDAAEQLRSILAASGSKYGNPDELASQLDQFISESEILVEAGSVLAAGDLRAFGRLAEGSLEAVAKPSRHQTPEIVFLAAAARRLGAAAVSMCGGGLGGSVWALVEADTAGDFTRLWADRYREAFARNAGSAFFFATGAGPAAFRVC